MTSIDPNSFEIAPSPQDLLDQARADASGIGSELPGQGAQADTALESPAELGDDALVDFTAAAQNSFNTEQMDGVPESVISVQSMLSTLVGSMTANATEAFATAAELSPKDALALTKDF